jgi:hypothetical protein
MQGARHLTSVKLDKHVMLWTGSPLNVNCLPYSR